jgi:hypothetical protein
MPCYETRVTTVALEASDLETLAKALESQGHSVTRHQGHLSGRTSDGYSFSFRNGRFTTDQNSSLAGDINATKRAYSRETIKAQAKRNGWQVQFQGDAFTVAKRRF